MKALLEKHIADICNELFNQKIEVEIDRTDEKFGDYSTNVCLKLAGVIGQSPKAIADQLTPEINKLSEIKTVSVAGPGFINLSLSDEALIKAINTQPPNSLKNQSIVVEYSDPNPFKILHAGHLYTSIIGDAIANLLELAGADVHRVNFGGDVGLHVAKAMWGIMQKLGGEYPEKLSTVNQADRAKWLSEAYVAGNKAYEEDAAVKQQIIAFNKKIYGLHGQNDHESAFAQIYWETRQWSYDYFRSFYNQIGIEFEKFYPESETSSLGLLTVKQHIGEVYEESQGAVIFNGDKYNLHTRVFINSEGLPTYEAKDVGLIMKKWQDYHFDLSIIITANDIIDYMKVVLKSIELFMPDLPKKTLHITHGIVKLAHGSKMSSRKGNIVKASDIIDAANKANFAATAKDDKRITLGAIKYAFTKNRIGGDIIYDPEESVSLEGNSGPYIQYSHARARSILRKAEPFEKNNLTNFDDLERPLISKLTEYNEVVERAIHDLSPHHICTYLYELAQTFNRFYEKARVIDDPRQATRLGLVKVYADTLKKGLSLLGIEAPDTM